MSRVHQGTHSPGLIRPRANRVFAGVCAGLARHFSVSVYWVRIFFIFGFILQGPLALVLYVVSIFLMSSEPKGSSSIPPIPKMAEAPLNRPLSPDLEREMLCLEFEDIEARLRLIEDHVTSKEFVLRQKFKDLS